MQDVLLTFNMDFDLLILLNTYDDEDRPGHSAVTYDSVGNPGPLFEQHYGLSLAELSEQGFSQLRVVRNAVYGMDMSSALLNLPFSRVMPCAGHAALRMSSKVCPPGYPAHPDLFAPRIQGKKAQMACATSLWIDAHHICIEVHPLLAGLAPSCFSKTQDYLPYRTWRLPALLERPTHEFFPAAMGERAMPGGVVCGLFRLML